jgi:hypothetical protein
VIYFRVCSVREWSMQVSYLWHATNVVIGLCYLCETIDFQLSSI